MVGGSLQRLYPFAYLLGINAAQLLVFAALFAPAAWRLLAGHWAPRFGTWRDAMDLPAGGPVLTRRAETLIGSGALLACLLGAVLSGWIYGVWPIGTPWLGRHTGAWVTGPVLAALGLAESSRLCRPHWLAAVLLLALVETLADAPVRQTSQAAIPIMT